MIVYHELMFGAVASLRREANEQKISAFVAGCDFVLLPFDEGNAREAGDIRAKHYGRP